MADIGVLASTDPVAIDQACLDLVFNHDSKPGDTAQPLLARIKKLHGTHTVDHAERIGLGTKKYELIDIDKRGRCFPYSPRHCHSLYRQAPKATPPPPCATLW